jgi:hypothetical protein
LEQHFLIFIFIIYLYYIFQFNNNMSAYNNNSNLKSDQNVRLNDGNNQLNENHGIAASGLGNPNLFAGANTTGNDLNYSGPIADTRKIDQNQTSYNDLAGENNPSKTNRHAGTCIPPVNTAEHARVNASNEGRRLDSEQSSHVSDLSGTRHDRNNYGSNQYSSAGIENPSNTHNATTATTGSHPMTSTGSDISSRNAYSQNVSAPEGDHGASHHHEGTHGQMLSGHKHNTHQPQDNALGSSEIDTKPSAGDKVKGNLEKLAGKISGNEAKVVKGDNIAHGRPV